MKQWDRDRLIAKDAHQEDALNFIIFASENDISTEKAINHLREKYKYNDITIKDLFKKAKVPMT